MEPAERQDPDWVKMAPQARIRYCVPGMEHVEVRRHGALTGSSTVPEFDCYIPPGNARAPGVILIHGGPIPANLLTTPKNWGIFQSYGRFLAASGFSAIMFDHRFHAPEQATRALSDIEDLICYVREHGEGLHIDTDRLCLWALSGGGIFLSPFLRETLPGIRCLVAYYAALHASLPEFSPATQLSLSTAKLPAMLIAHAGLDSAAMNEAMDLFIQQALKKNASMDVLNHADGQHGFCFRDDNERTRDILRRTVDFIRLHVTG